MSFTTVSYNTDSATDETTVAKIYDIYNIKKDKTVEITRVDGSLKYIPLIDFCGVDLRLDESVSEPTLSKGILTVKSDEITDEEYQSASDLAESAGHGYRSTQADVYERLHIINYSKNRKKYWLYDDVVIHKTTRTNECTITFKRSGFDLYNLCIKLTLLPKTDQTVTHWNRILYASLGANVIIRCCDFETIFNTHEYGVEKQNYTHEMLLCSHAAIIQIQMYNSFKITHLNCASYIDYLAMNKVKNDAVKWLQVYNNIYGTSYSDYSLGSTLPNGDIIGVVYNDTLSDRFLSASDGGRIYFCNQATCVQGRHTYFSGECRYFSTTQTSSDIRQVNDSRYKKILRVPENEKLYVYTMYQCSRKATVQPAVWCDLQGVRNTDGTWVRCFQAWGKTFPDVEGAAPITDCALPGYQKYIDLGIDIWTSNDISETNPYNNTVGINNFIENSIILDAYPNYEPMLTINKIKTFIANGIR